MKMQKLGKITTEYGAFPESHELATAKVFSRSGFDVLFLVPSRTAKGKTPDVQIDGVLWEIKSPTGNSKRTLDNITRRASKQSANIIIDTRRTSLSDEFIVNQLKNNQNILHGIRRIKVVNKKAILLDIRG